MQGFLDIWVSRRVCDARKGEANHMCCMYVLVAFFVRQRREDRKLMVLILYNSDADVRT